MKKKVFLINSNHTKHIRPLFQAGGRVESGGGVDLLGAWDQRLSATVGLLLSSCCPRLDLDLDLASRRLKTTDGR